MVAAQGLGVPYLSAYLDAVGSNFSHGANFATWASTIRPQNITLNRGGFSPISLNVQWNQFYQFQSRTQYFRSQGGVYEELLPKAEYFSEALYTFDIGQNDLSAGYFLNLSTNEVRSYVPDLMDQFRTIIKNIYGGGGEVFLDTQYRPSWVSPICDGPSAHQSQPSGPSWMRQPIQRGFREPLRACCGHGGKYNFNSHVGCGGKIKVKGKEILVGKSCKDPSVVINWDEVHYTEAANKWVFDRIVDGSFSYPPVPLACHRVE
ncbi:hypothetical protein Drorol1_Dr00008100 [Drosera rotundifolia]